MPIYLSIPYTSFHNGRTEWLQERPCGVHSKMFALCKRCTDACFKQNDRRSKIKTSVAAE